jgi:hypothetical protein
VDGTQLLVNLLEGLLDEVGLADIALPCLNLYAMFLGQFGGDILGVL